MRDKAAFGPPFSLPEYRVAEMLLKNSPKTATIHTLWSVFQILLLKMTRKLQHFVNSCPHRKNEVIVCQFQPCLTPFFDLGPMKNPSTEGGFRFGNILEMT